jgi:hypothetical protein
MQVCKERNQVKVFISEHFPCRAIVAGSSHFYGRTAFSAPGAVLEADEMRC